MKQLRQPMSCHDMRQSWNIILNRPGNDEDFASPTKKVKRSTGVVDMSFLKRRSKNASTFEREIFGRSFEIKKVEEDKHQIKKEIVDESIICVLDQYPNEKDEKVDEDKKTGEETIQKKKTNEEEKPSQVMERMREVIARKPWLESNWMQLEAELKEESFQEKALREHGHESIFQTLAVEFEKDEKFEKVEKFEEDKKIENFEEYVPDACPSDAIAEILEGAPFGTDHQVDILESLKADDPREAVQLMNIIFQGIDSRSSLEGEA